LVFFLFPRRGWAEAGVLYVRKRFGADAHRPVIQIPGKLIASTLTADMCLDEKVSVLSCISFTLSLYRQVICTKAEADPEGGGVWVSEPPFV
jgi:hypothetical protein